MGRRRFTLSTDLLSYTDAVSGEGKYKWQEGKSRRRHDGAATRTLVAHTQIHTTHRQELHITPHHRSDKLEIGVERSRTLFHSRIAIKSSSLYYEEVEEK